MQNLFDALAACRTTDVPCKHCGTLLDEYGYCPPCELCDKCDGLRESHEPCCPYA